MITKILRHGTACGVDSDVSSWVIANHPEVRVIPHPADWRKHGREAGKIRNREMLAEAGESIVITGGRQHKTTDEEMAVFWAIFQRIPNGLIAFPGGNGTMDCTQQAYSMSIPVYPIRIRGRLVVI